MDLLTQNQACLSKISYMLEKSKVFYIIRTSNDPPMVPPHDGNAE